MTEAPDVADNVLYDGKVADKAVEALRAIKDKPFSLAVGFIKPHTPFVAPKKYWDLYDPAEIKLAANEFFPKDAPRIAGHNSGEVRRYTDQPKHGPFTERNRRRLRHGYFACISYIDAQIGRVLDELDTVGLREKTIIALYGDNGWHLGEHDLWGKQTNFEIAARAPLIISVPGLAKGKRTAALAEFVDIYPTLCEAAGLKLPPHLEGQSLIPLLENPNRPGKPTAFTQYLRSLTMGYSMKTDRYRYTEWITRKSGKVVERELYDHRNDPAETVNLAQQPSFAELAKQLSTPLAAERASWSPEQNKSQ